MARLKSVTVRLTESAYKAFKHRLMEKKEKIKNQELLTDLLQAGVQTDGGHHKQWFLEQIAEALEIKLGNYPLTTSTSYYNS